MHPQRSCTYVIIWLMAETSLGHESSRTSLVKDLPRAASKRDLITTRLFTRGGVWLAESKHEKPLGRDTKVHSTKASARCLFDAYREYQALLHCMTVRPRCGLRRGLKVPASEAGSLIDLLCQTASMTNASVVAAFALVRMTMYISSHSQESWVTKSAHLLLGCSILGFHPSPRTLLVYRKSSGACTTSSDKKVRKKERNSHRLQLVVLLGTTRIKTA